MKWLKHILVVIALMVAAMPCCHAHEHETHAHDADAETTLAAYHTCCCHSCESTDGLGEADHPQELTVSVVAAPPVASIQLFIFIETKPAVQQVPLRVASTLVALQTIQLLI